jgi:hypothetical protein
LGMAPFVADLWIMFIVFSLWFINIIIFYTIKKIYYLYIFLYLIYLALNYGIILLIWLKNFFDINIEIFSYSLNYFYIILSTFVIITFFILIFKKLYLYISIIFFILLPIPISYNLLEDTINLNNSYNFIIKSMNKRVDNSIIFISPLIFNNMIISRDLSYRYNWKEHKCRFSLSYYRNINPNLLPFTGHADKSADINLYVWFEDNELCRQIIQRDFKYR